MSEWSAHNQAVVNKSVKDFIAQQKRLLVAKLRKVAKEMLDNVDIGFVRPPFKPGGSDQFPVWTGQMADSIGLGLYIDGVTEYLMAPKNSIEFQTSGNYQGKIYGHELLQQMITITAAKYPQGIWMVLFTAVPYAQSVDSFGSPADRGVGFFTKLTEIYSYELTQMLN